MKAIVFINRFLMIVATLFFILGLDDIDDNTFVLVLFSAIPLGAFQIIASLFLISYIKEMTKLLKMSLYSYYVLVVFYSIPFITFLIGKGTVLSEVILIVIPVILAIGLTVIIELTYKETKEINEVID